MSNRPDPVVLVVKVVALALAGWLFVVVLRITTAPTTIADKRETVLRKITDTAKYLRFQSPYTNEQLQRRVKEYAK